MPTKPIENSRLASNSLAMAPHQAVAGSPDDPRMQEALRLVRAFLAIEDAEARGALIAQAERLISYDWLLKAQKQ